MGMGDFFKYISSSDEDRKLEAEEMALQKNKLLRKEQLEQLAELLKEQSGVAAGEQSEAALSKALMEQPIPISTTPGLTMARGIAVPETEAAKIYAKQESERNPLPINERLSMFRAENPEIGEEYMKAKEHFAKMNVDGESGAGGLGLGGWGQRAIDWDKISEMPDGAEKEKAKVEYLYKWAPSSGYAASPEGIAQAGKRAGATTGARIQTEAALAPVSAQTGGTIAAGKAKGAREGGVTLSETSAERLGDFSGSLSQLKTLSAQFANPDAPQGPIAQMRKLNPYDWQAQAKQQLVATTKQTVGKALEGGVLRKEDEEKYDKILPKLGDTYEAAVEKAKNLEIMLNNAYRAKVGALKKAGYAVDQFDPESIGGGQMGGETSIRYVRDPSTGKLVRQ